MFFSFLRSCWTFHLTYVTPVPPDIEERGGDATIELLANVNEDTDEQRESSTQSFGSSLAAFFGPSPFLFLKYLNSE